jgi:UDP-N-acetylmuramate dehydrogenase
MDRFEELLARLHDRVPTLELRQHEPMSRHTTFRVGGPVRLMALPRSEEEAEAAVRTAAGLGVRPEFLGNGSNLLVADEGVEAFVIKTMDGLNTCLREGNTICAGSGLLLARLANCALEQGLTGLEFAHGIPGSVGGAVTMNAGAYEGEMSQVVSAVTCLTAQGERQRVTEFEFGYRDSCFQDGSRLILNAEFTLVPGDREQIREKMNRLMRQRRAKQPLEYPSAGSTFRRPQGYYAAALIDQCGLKGLQVGGAQVSEKHAGFVINRGGATCRDILTLVERVRGEVLRQTGVELELEVKTLGV